MAPKPDEGPLTKQEEDFLRDVRTKPDPWAFERLFRVEDRDHPGSLIPLRMNAGQTLIEDAVRRMLDLNLKFQVDAWRQGQPTYLEPAAIQAFIEKGVRPLDHQIGLRLNIGKSRRGGFSTWTLAKGFKRISTTPNYSCLLMAHVDDSAQDIWQIAKRYFDHWPNEWIRLRPDDKYNSQEYFEYDRIESRYAISTAGKNAESESKRGWRFDLYHFSEYAHYRSFADVSQCMSASLPYSWVIKESTANGRSGPFYEEWQKAITIDEAEEAYEKKDYEFLSKWGTPGTYKFFFSWLDDPGLVLPVYDGEKDLLLRDLDEYERILLDKDPRFTLPKVKWRRTKIREDCQHHPRLSPIQLFQQEFPATPDEMFQATGSTVFDQERVEQLVTRARPAKLHARVWGTRSPMKTVPAAANFRLFAEPRPDRAYVIGGDISKGVEQDYSVAIVLDRHDGTRLSEAAMFRSNVIDEREFGHVLTLLAEMYNGAYLIPEINQGLVAATTIVTDNRYWNIYERKSLDMVTNDGSDNSFRFGFFTTAQTKGAIVQLTRNMLLEGRLELHSPELLGEMRIFQVDPDTQKYGVPKGEHDDTVLALCLGVHGSRYAPSIDSVVARAKDRGEVVEKEGLLPYERRIFAAIAAKKERDMKKSKRQGGEEYRVPIK